MLWPCTSKEFMLLWRKLLWVFFSLRDHVSSNSAALVCKYSSMLYAVLNIFKRHPVSVWQQPKYKPCQRNYCCSVSSVPAPLWSKPLMQSKPATYSHGSSNTSIFCISLLPSINVDVFQSLTFISNGPKRLHRVRHQFVLTQTAFTQFFQVSNTDNARQINAG